MNFKDQRELDLAVFTNPKEFGQVAILSEDGYEREIDIIVMQQPDDLKGLDQVQVIFKMLLSDAPYLNKDAQFILEGEVYRIIAMPENFGEEIYPRIVMTKVDDAI